VNGDAPGRDRLVMTGRMASLLYDALAVEHVRLQVRGRSPELDATLFEWSEVRRREHERVMRSVTGTEPGENAEVVASLPPVMTTIEVADLARVTPRAVTKAAASGRLAGRRVGPIWLFDRDSALRGLTKGAWRDV
jgi:hypothetical protein